MNIKNFTALLYWSVVVCSCSFSLSLKTHNFIFRSFAFAAALLFYFSLIPILTSKLKYLKQDINNKLVLLYLLIVAGILLISLKTDINSLITLFTYPYSFLAFFIAVVALTVDTYSIQVLVKMSRFFNTVLPFIFLIDLAIFKVPVLTNDLCYFLLFEFALTQQKKLRIIYLTVLIIAVIFISNYFDNRAFVIRFTGVSFLFSAFYYFKFLRKQIFKSAVAIVTVLLAAFVSIYFEEIFRSISQLIPNKTINDTDTRTFIFSEFFSSFKGGDWIPGRGYLGTYFSTYFFHSHDLDSDYYMRFTAEVGTVDILLKGGLLLLIPFLYLILKAVNKGFVNGIYGSMSFKLSIFLVVELFLFSIENFPSFSIHFMFIWLAVGVIFQEKKINIILNSSPNLIEDNIYCQYNTKI